MMTYRPVVTPTQRAAHFQDLAEHRFEEAVIAEQRGNQAMAHEFLHMAEEFEAKATVAMGKRYSSASAMSA